MYLMVSGLAPKNFVQLLIFAAAAGEFVWSHTMQLHRLSAAAGCYARPSSTSGVSSGKHQQQ
jgi:hypothetical protein